LKKNAVSVAAPIWMRKKKSRRITSSVCSENAGVKPRNIPSTTPQAMEWVPLSELRSFRKLKICFRINVMRES
jgi:hypothetical protein